MNDNVIPLRQRQTLEAAPGEHIGTCSLCFGGVYQEESEFVTPPKCCNCGAVMVAIGPLLAMRKPE